MVGNADGTRLSSLRRLGTFRLVLVLAFMAGVLAAIWAGYRLYAGYVARALQEELLVIARVTGVSLEKENRPEERARVLSQVAEAAGLENAQLSDAQGRSLADARPQVRRGSIYSPVLLDRNALREALEGEAAFGPAQNIGGFPFRAVYTPVKYRSQPAVLVLSAGEEYAGILLDLRSAAWRVSAVAAIAMVFYAVLFGLGERLSRRIERQERRRRGLILVGMLAAEVAHRIRNPLAIIQSTAEKIRRRHSEQYGEDPLLDYIPQEVERVDRAVEQLLSVGRPAPAVTQVVALREILRDAVETSGVRKRYPGLQVDAVSLETAEECLVEADPDALREAFVNLIVNAAEAVGEKGRVTVSVERSPDSEACTAVVSDNGPGIPRSQLEHVFDPFYTMKPNGTGLGLAIAGNTFEQHDAGVNVESNKEGTTFRISFKICRRAAGE